MANRYWVGGAGDWDNVTTTHWSATSGGAGGASVPTTTDDVFFDANSGSNTVTLGVNPTIHNLNYTGFTGTFNCPSISYRDIDITGTILTFDSGMTLSSTYGVFFSITNSVGEITTFTTDGLALESKAGIIFKGAGTFELADNVVFSTTSSPFAYGGIEISGGTFNTNNYNINCRAFTLQGYYNATIANLGSSTITITSSQNTGCSIRDNTYGLTLNAGTSLLYFQNCTNYDSYCLLGGKTYYNLKNNYGPTYALFIADTGSTFNNIELTAGSKIKFEDNTITTFNTLTANGTAGNNITFTNNGGSGTSILYCTSGTIAVNYCNISYSRAVGGATFTATNSTDSGNNAGWNFGSGVTKIAFTNPGNIYSSNDSYATAASLVNGILTVELSKDAGSTWTAPLTKTFTGSDSLLTFGAGATELWGTSWTRANMTDANFRVRLSAYGYSTIYKTFGFTTGSDILTGLEIAIEGNYASSTLSLDLLEVKIYYGTSILPVQAGSQAFASDGRKAGEGAGAGTGLLVYYDGNAWIASDTGATVAA